MSRFVIAPERAVRTMAQAAVLSLIRSHPPLVGLNYSHDVEAHEQAQGDLCPQTHSDIFEKEYGKGSADHIRKR